MSEETKTTIETEAEVIEDTEYHENFISKAKNGFKKHGKKIAIIASVAVVAGIGIALGHKVKSSSLDYDHDDLVEVVAEEICSSVDPEE